MELARFPLHGGFSVRSIFTFVLTVVMAVLLWATLSSVPAQAQAATASWTSDSILHDQHVYKKVDANQTPQGIPSDATVYAYHPVATTSNTTANQEAYFLYFASGVDPPTATTAEYVAYDYNAANKSYSNAHDKKSITITPKGEEAPLSSCSVSGIGWIICPVTVFLAESMDFLFGIIAGFLTVQPLLSTSDNGLYTAWNVMRNVANVAFVIGFIIIIYSQLTSFGVSNYGIKRLLPRLILAALFVNLSFTISALAVDASNILGHSIQQVFEYIRDDIFNMNADTWGDGLNSGWASLAAAVLAGGGAIAGTMYVISSGAYMLLIPIVLLLALTLLLVLIVLAARQAIIIILVVISPLAFVANLLPNTEKWFDKWRDLFMTMLIFFPAFSLAFGGAQLAGQIIIMNAGDNIITVIFGMAVQIAPLVITPLLLKLSGGLLGRIAQLANNPNKGLLDRNRKWAHDKAEERRLSSVGKDLSGKSRLNPLTYGTRMVKANDFRRRDLANKLERNKNYADTRYLERADYRDLHDQMHDAEVDKKLVQAQLDEHTQKHTLTSKVQLEKDMKIRLVGDKTAELKGQLDATYDELKAGQTSVSSRYGAAFSPLEQEATETARSIALNGMRQQSAKRAQTQNLYQDLKDNTAKLDGQLLRDYAGGVQGHIGAQRALAQAISEQHRAHQEVITNANAILDDYNLNADDNLKVAMNTSVRGIDITEDIQEAAIKRVAANGVIPHINKLLTSVDFSATGNEDYRLALVDGLKGNGSRPKYIGFGTMDKITQGIPMGITDNTIDTWIEDMLVAGKLSAKELASQDRDTLVRVNEAIKRLNAKQGRTAKDQVAYAKGIQQLRDEITAVRSDGILWNAAGERKGVIDEMEKLL